MRIRILVTGATGTVGREVCRLLAREDVEVVGATRHPDAAADALTDAPPDGAPTVARWVPLDYERPEGHAAAFEGVERLFLIARPGDADPAAAAGPLLRAARAAGVRQIVNLTALGADRREDVPLGRVERLVEEGGFAWTHLRPNWFMQVFSVGPLLAGIRTTGRLAVPAGDARISFVDARDVAAVAARALLEEGHDGRAYDLTGAESLTHAEIASILATASGCPVAYEPLDEDEARAAIVASGLSVRRAERLILFYRLVRAGHAAPVSGDVEAVLGRSPIPFTRFAADHADAWRLSAAATQGHPHEHRQEHRHEHASNHEGGTS